MIPHMPAGATVRALISARYALGKTISANRAATVLLHGYAVIDSAELASSLGLTPLEVLHRHTLAPLTLALQSKPGADTLRRLMLDPPRHVSVKYGDLNVATNVRRCPGCVREDVERIGFAFSRAIHQLRAVVTCPSHSLPLEEFCANCGAPYSNLEAYRKENHLAEQLAVCAACGGSTGQPLQTRSSAGYDDYLMLVTEAMQLSGRAPLLTPARRFSLIERAAALAREHRVNLADEFCSFWGGTDFTDALSLAHTMRHEFEATFTGDRLPYRPHLAFVATSFALKVLTNFGIDYAGEFSPVDGFRSYADDDPLWCRLAPTASEWEIPPHVIRGLIRGLKPQSSGVPISNFLDALSQSDRDELRIRQARRRRDSSFLRTADRLSLEAKGDGAHIDPDPSVSQNRPPSAILRARAFLRAYVHSEKEGAVSLYDARQLLVRMDPTLHDELLERHPGWLVRCFPPRPLFWEDPNRGVQGPVETADTNTQDRRAEVLNFLKEYTATTHGDQLMLGARKALIKKNRALYTWCYRSDKTWFNKHVPMLVPPADLEPGQAITHRDEKRRQVLAILESIAGESPGSPETRSRRQFVAAYFKKLYVWFAKYDKEWFDKNVPGGGSKAPWYRRTVGPNLQDAVVALKQDDYASLTDLNLRRYSLYSWLRKNHPEILREHFEPKKIASARKPTSPSRAAYGPQVSAEEKEAKRLEVLRILEARRAGTSSVKTSVSPRAAVASVKASLYLWCLKHDREWFDENVPYVRKRLL